MPDYPTHWESEHFSPVIGMLAEILTRKGRHFATAESCTGGLIAALCTDIPGSSAWFKGGVVAYANTLKSAILQVPPALIAEQGAVSETTVLYMAESALSLCGVDIAVAVSGVAGPDGGTEEKPVGTVCIGYALRGNGVPPECYAYTHHFPGDRKAVRLATALSALQGVVRLADTRF